jgi:hypothetical protein
MSLRIETLRKVVHSITAIEFRAMLENYAGHRQKLAVGMKQVQGQLESLPEFWKEFRRRGYIVFCLIRKNVTKSSLSTTVAAQPGPYNTARQNYQDESCVVPLDKLDNYLESFGGERESYRNMSAMPGSKLTKSSTRDSWRTGVEFIDTFSRRWEFHTSHRPSQNLRNWFRRIYAKLSRTIPKWNLLSASLDCWNSWTHRSAVERLA